MVLTAKVDCMSEGHNYKSPFSIDLFQDPKQVLSVNLETLFTSTHFQYIFYTPMLV